MSMSKALKILIIDNTRDPKSFGSTNLVHWALKSSPEGSEVMVRRGPDQDLPSKKFKPDAILISGSVTSCLEKTEPWIHPHDQFLSDHIEKGTPMLGVCYGHQAIARCLFKMNGVEPKLRQAPVAELGWAQISIIDESPLLEGIKGSFYSYQSHYEEVEELPPQASAFAETTRCKIQGIQVKGKPIFGIQFHPEYDIEEGESSLKEKIARGVRADFFINPGQGAKYYDENVGKVIFGNFFRIAAGHA